MDVTAESCCEEELSSDRQCLLGLLRNRTEQCSLFAFGLPVRI